MERCGTDDPDHRISLPVCPQPVPMAALMPHLPRMPYSAFGRDISRIWGLNIVGSPEGKNWSRVV